MEDRRGRRRAQADRATLSWGFFLLVTLVGIVAVLTRMLDTGPAGVSSSGQAMALAGSYSFNLGNAPTVTAPEAYLFDADTGMVFYTKHADEEHPMASTTKVMTMLLAVERGNLDQVITVGADAAALVRADSSYMGLSKGEKLTLRDLLYGLVLPSGNDAAVAIADAIGGSVPQFVALMNQRAVELGLSHTHYVTPHGLDAPGHYTSARDLAVLGAVAMQNATLRQVTSVKFYDIPKTSEHKAYHLQSGNDLLPRQLSPYPGAIGIKPGYTGKAGFTMAFAAVRHGHMIVGAVLGDPSWQVRITDMRALLDWGFEQEGLPPAAAPTPWTDVPNV
jgi:D-alanyl-D-alanine carboxypeptidase (penicillin-binding protein 5/6)